METYSEEQKKMMIEEPLLNTPSPKGGLRTMPFIIVNEAFEKVASCGLLPNMILYLMNEYHMDMPTGTNILNFQSAATNFTPIIGAFLADSILGRFFTIGFGSIFSLLGMALLWSTTLIPQARPPPCNDYNCSSSTPFQLALLCSSFGLMSIGAGGIRGPSIAFGADQLNKGDGQGHLIKDEAVLERYFGWYYASSALSVVLAFTFIVYIQEHMGWKVGFGVSVGFMSFSALAFFLASPFYIKFKAKSSLLSGLVQAIVASYKNRHITLPSQSTNVMYHHDKKGSTLVVPSDKLRFLNKACIIRDPQQDLTPDGRAVDSWSLCTVDQVEELKALLKVIPLLSTSVIMFINVSQTSFGTIQTKTMDRHLTSSFEIPVGSFSMFTIISIILWVFLYDRIILLVASKIMGRPIHFSAKQRMGFGIFLSGLSMAVTAIVESIRRREAIREGFSDDPQGMVNMSAMWLIPQHCLSGFAEGLSIIGQIEFYISEFPRSMSSIASNMGGAAMSLANLLASVIMNSIDQITQRGGKVSWISSNINKGHYDYYYWVLAGLSFLNLIYFSVCSWAYGPCKGEATKDPNEGCKVGDE